MIGRAGGHTALPVPLPPLTPRLGPTEACDRTRRCGLATRHRRLGSCPRHTVATHDEAYDGCCRVGLCQALPTREARTARFLASSSRTKHRIRAATLASSAAGRLLTRSPTSGATKRAIISVCEPL